MIHYRIKLVSIILFSLLYGCGNEEGFDFPEINHEKDLSEIIRTEKKFFGLAKDKLQQELSAFELHHPNAAELYLQNILQLGKGPAGKNDYRERSEAFFYNKSVLGLYDTIALLENTVVKELARLQRSFNYFHYYFPNTESPEIFTAITEFAPSAFTLDSLALGISLDMFLGSDFKYYPGLDFPKYMYDHFELDHLASNTMFAWYDMKFPLKKRNANLLDEMIHKGKLYYLLDRTLEATPDHIKINYYPKDITWCRNNEPKIWEFFIEKELLYEGNKTKYGKYIHPGPTSSGMPPESPGNIASWLGWQIVRSYMKAHPKSSLNDLMKIQDGQKILMKSKYRP